MSDYNDEANLLDEKEEEVIELNAVNWDYDDMQYQHGYVRVLDPSTGEMTYMPCQYILDQYIEYMKEYELMETIEEEKI